MQKIGVWAFGLYLCGVSWPALACKNLAKTELEQVFCEVKARKSSALPYSLKEFRKNPASTQRLLLARPAQRLGIAMPKLPAKLQTPPRAAPLADRSSKIQSDTKPKQKTAQSMKPPVEHLWGAATHNLLAGCQLKPTYIQCADGKYQLLDNLPNHQLAKGAFTRRLSLPEFSGREDDVSAVKRYVVRCYGLYVQRMVDIGLAGVTMSFTKFFHTYEAVGALGVSFTQRMEDMFEYLKRDKTSMGAPLQHKRLLPKTLDQCGRLTAKILVCDDVKRNWVYFREGE